MLKVDFVHVNAISWISVLINQRVINLLVREYSVKNASNQNVIFSLIVAKMNRHILHVWFRASLPVLGYPLNAHQTLIRLDGCLDWSYDCLTSNFPILAEWYMQFCSFIGQYDTLIYILCVCIFHDEQCLFMRKYVICCTKMQTCLHV